MNIWDREKTSGKKLRQKTYDTVPQLFPPFSMRVNRLEDDLRWNYGTPFIKGDEWKGLEPLAKMLFGARI